ncbi:hypothetical protein VRU48_09335 [Pedobacter sp. KR3-3]|uniref:Phosphatidylcholine 1-acylhydrolase n=1 Tax=Pedobacter albus TaxID=3113905 RepID=A0ABU7I757_9SPHI|nr:hypothetical protein [Pedobacter sp. KR3-3]MEE1945310.1 hypothetical protein [Pedobacter sp. KR3-3]
MLKSSLYFILAFCLMILSAKSQITDVPKSNIYDFVKAKALKKERAYDTVYINKLKANAYFNEEISSTVFLSKASFYVNKRWMTKADIPDRYPYVLDAIVSPYFRISSDRWNIGWGEGNLMLSLYFNPDFEVRIFENQASLGDASHPVRTASFRPGGELFVRYNNPNSLRKTHFAFSLKGNHHSDGQDGEEFNSVDRPWGKKGYANTYNGDFSDDFLLGFNAMAFRRTTNHNLFAKLGFSTSTGTSEGLKTYKVYGTRRINLLSSWAWIPNYEMSIKGAKLDTFKIEKTRVEFYVSYITNRMNVGSIYNLQRAKFSDRINFHATLHFRIRGFSAAGLFLEGGYYGQDLYNIYYQQSSWFAKLGISFGLFKYSYPKL